jgi:uncharacterized protein
MRIRPSNYLTVIPYQEDLLILQGYKGVIILVKKKTWDEIIANKYISDDTSELTKIKLNLLAKMILIPEGMDETKMVKDVFEKAHASAGKELFLGLFLTLRCNFACPYCFQDEQKADITKEKIDQSLEQLFGKVKETEAKKIKIEFWGGEPLLCLDKFEYTVKKARELNTSQIKIEFTLVTNGSIFDPRIEKLFEKEKDLAHAQITIDGSQEMHDRRRFFKGGRGSYQKILGNLVNWLKVAEKIAVRVNIDEENKDHIAELFNDLAKLNVDRERIGISLANVSQGWGRGESREEILDNSDYKKVESDLYSLAEQMGFGVPKGKFPRYHPVLCMASGPFAGWVDPEGEIYCCARVAGNKDYSLGNIKDSLQNHKTDIWHKYQIINNPTCLKCKHLFFCAGICPTEAMKGVKTTKFCGSGFEFYLEKNLAAVVERAVRVEKMD